jgi:glutathione S-transferase
MTYTLYHCPQTRSSQILWLAEEIGAPYEIHKIDINTGAGKDRGDFETASPFGKVPAIRDGNVAINETAAIALYLADKYSYGNLAPKHDAPNRGDYYRWIVTSASTFDAALINVMTKRETVERAQASAPRVADFITATLHKHPYLTGETFTAADVLIGSGLRWGLFMKAIEPSAAISDYVARIGGRPAAKRAQEIDAKLKSAA